MDSETGEFQDWEVLHRSPASSPVNSPNSIIAMGGGFEEIGGDSDVSIRPDYFSIGSQNNIEDFVDSDKPSWVNPDLESRRLMKDSGEIVSDSRSDMKFCELGSVDDDEIEVGFEGVEKIAAAESENYSEKSSFNSDKISELGIAENENSSGGLEISGEEKGDEDEGKRIGVWWKLPSEFLRCSVFKVSSPLWALSVTAAAMGVMILGRQWYMMKKKKKSRSLEVKLTLHDKKVSQFTSRAARLNEAFSAVRLVPVIRPSLPAAGETPWPVISLR